MKNRADWMKKFVALLGIIAVSSAFADDQVGVVARVTCADIQTQISEMSAVEEPDSDTIDALTKLKADYRRLCSRSARGRKTSTGARVIVENESEPSTVTEEKSDEQEDEVEQVEKQSEILVEDETLELTEDELLEQELANLDAGLCADGTEPNKFGCCGDELFKDLGDAVFACCPKDGGDCFPPIK